MLKQAAMENTSSAHSPPCSKTKAALYSELEGNQYLQRLCHKHFHLELDLSFFFCTWHKVECQDTFKETLHYVKV